MYTDHEEKNIIVKSIKTFQHKKLSEVLLPFKIITIDILTNIIVIYFIG